MASVRLTVRVLVVPILLASLVLMGSGVMASGAASASPSSCYPPGAASCTGKLTASPSTVVPGGTLTIGGKGFNAGAKVSINVCNVEKVTTTASHVGIISVGVTMPVKTPLGSCKLTATGLGTNGQILTLTATVTVKRATKTVLKLSCTGPRLTALCPTGKVTYGNEQVEQMLVTVSPEFAGSTPTGTVTVKASATTLCTIKLSSGKGSCRLTAKELRPGTYHLVATYGGNLKFAGSFSNEVRLVVTPGSTTGKLTASPSTVSPGGTVTISGKGFNAGATVSINVCNVKTVTTIASDVGITGLINVPVTMPDKTPLGSCKLTATGLGTNSILTLTGTVTVKSAT